MASVTPQKKSNLVRMIQIDRDPRTTNPNEEVDLHLIPIRSLHDESEKRYSQTMNTSLSSSVSKSYLLVSQPPRNDSQGAWKPYMHHEKLFLAKFGFGILGNNSISRRKRTQGKTSYMLQPRSYNYN